MRLFVLCMATMICCGCMFKPANKKVVTRYAFTHGQMGTVFRLIFYTDADSAQAQRIARQVFNTVDTLNAVMSDYLPDSELNRLCATAGSGSSVAVSTDLYRVLSAANQFSIASNGAFDVTVGPLTRLWRRARSLKEAPDSARVAAAKQLTDYRQMVFFPPNRVQLLQAGMGLDLGGIAQGFAADECLKQLRTFGIHRALVDAGGDIILGDPPPEAQGWQIEIPAGAGEKNSLILANTAITTSGATYKYLEINGIRYSHIIDPRTGWGLTRRILVTVQAPTCTQADAWATAISVLGSEGWLPLQKQYPDLSVKIKYD